MQRNIVREFAYQSSLELSPEVFAVIQGIPVATDLARHARQELVRRLEQYGRESPRPVPGVVGLIESKLMPVVHAHAMSGHAQINSEEALARRPGGACGW